MPTNLFLGKISDNKDPDNMSRVKVSTLGETESVSDWMPYLTTLSGNSTGYSSLPNVDEQVLVATIDEQHAQKVAIGVFWTSSMKPPKSGENSDADFNQDGKNSLHFVKSKSGNKIIFDDTEKKEKIQIIAADEKSRIDFLVNDKKMAFKTENDIAIGAKGSITISSEEISISSKKKMNISGDEIQVQGKKKMDIQASQDLSLKGSGIALN